MNHRFFPGSEFRVHRLLPGITAIYYLYQETLTSEVNKSINFQTLAGKVGVDSQCVSGGFLVESLLLCFRRSIRLVSFIIVGIISSQVKRSALLQYSCLHSWK